MKANFVFLIIFLQLFIGGNFHRLPSVENSNKTFVCEAVNENFILHTEKITTLPVEEQPIYNGNDTPVVFGSHILKIQLHSQILQNILYHKTESYLVQNILTPNNDSYYKKRFNKLRILQI